MFFETLWMIIILIVKIFWDTTTLFMVQIISTKIFSNRFTVLSVDNVVTVTSRSVFAVDIES